MYYQSFTFVLQMYHYVLPVIYALPVIHVCITNSSFCNTGHLCTTAIYVCITNHCFCITSHLSLYYNPIILYYRSFMYYQNSTFVLPMNHFALPVMYVLPVIHICNTNALFCITGHLCITSCLHLYFK